MEWIDREKEFPECDKILCCGNGNIFICELLETKWGHYYSSTDWNHVEHRKDWDWTHWIPLPDPPS